MEKKPRIHPMVILLLGFLIVMFIGAFFLMLPISNTNDKWLDFTEALFTSASAVCVTGLVVRPTLTAFTTFGHVIILLLIQIGGLGTMTITTLLFILFRKRITLKNRVALQEALGQNKIKGVVKLVLTIVKLTVLIELAGTILLTPFFCVKNGGIGVWQALFTSISAFCNAGFDITGANYASLTEYNGNAGVLLIVALLIILGGLGFAVMRDVFDCKFRFRKYQLHTKIVIIMTVSLIVFGTIFFFASEYNSAAFADFNVGEKMLNSLFQSVTSRTAGFNSIDQNALSRPGKIITCLLMFIGAAPSGTGGGIKITTAVVLVIMGIAGLRGKDTITLGMHTITIKTCLRAVFVTMLALILILLGTLIISATNDINTNLILFDTISAFSNTGLSTGICCELSNIGLICLIVIMFIGRLGLLNVGLIFIKQDKLDIKYPNAYIMIG